MKIEMDKIYLIVDKSEKLIAKGTPRNRTICHIEENDRKRILTYTSKKLAENAFKNSGFYLSDYVRNYVKNEHPELADSTFIGWEDIKHLFSARAFKVTYDEIE